MISHQIHHINYRSQYTPHTGRNRWVDSYQQMCIVKDNNKNSMWHRNLPLHNWNAGNDKCFILWYHTTGSWISWSYSCNRTKGRLVYWDVSTGIDGQRFSLLRQHRSHTERYPVEIVPEEVGVLCSGIPVSCSMCGEPLHVWIIQDWNASVRSNCHRTKVKKQWNRDWRTGDTDEYIMTIRKIIQTSWIGQMLSLSDVSVHLKVTCDSRGQFVLLSRRSGWECDVIIIIVGHNSDTH